MESPRSRRSTESKLLGKRRFTLTSTVTPNEMLMPPSFVEMRLGLREERCGVGHAQAGTQAKDSGLRQNKADEPNPSSRGSVQYILLSRNPAQRTAEKSQLFQKAVVGTNSVSAWIAGRALEVKMDQPLKKHRFPR